MNPGPAAADDGHRAGAAASLESAAPRSFPAQAWIALSRPGPAPAVWWRKAVAVVGGTILFTLFLAYLGWKIRDDAARYFGEKKAGTILSVFFLIGSAYACRVIERKPQSERFRRFWRIQSFFMVFLALDELFRIHERIDRLFHQMAGADPDHWLTDHLDDVILSGYALFAAAVWWRYRRELLRLPWMVLTMVVAGICIAKMLIADMTDLHQAIEDGLKLVAGSLIFSGFYAGAAEMDRQGDGLTKG